MLYYSIVYYASAQLCTRQRLPEFSCELLVNHASDSRGLRPISLLTLWISRGLTQA